MAAVLGTHPGESALNEASREIYGKPAAAMGEGGTIPFMAMLGEMFPNQIRGSSLAVAGFFQWFANFLIAFTFPVMAAWSLTGSYVFYGVCAVISFFLVQKFVHETKGKELEEMQG